MCFEKAAANITERRTLLVTVACVVAVFTNFYLRTLQTSDEEKGNPVPGFLLHLHSTPQFSVLGATTTKRTSAQPSTDTKKNVIQIRLCKLRTSGKVFEKQAQCVFHAKCFASVTFSRYRSRYLYVCVCQEPIVTPLNFL